MKFSALNVDFNSASLHSFTTVIPVSLKLTSDCQTVHGVHDGVDVHGATYRCNPVDQV